MKTRTVYHGSSVEVAVPCIVKNGNYKDFGYGFYCTELILQAKKWAISKKRKGFPTSVVNQYTYTENPDLKILKFEEMTDKWIDFVVACRRGKEHQYDIVEGPMADDQIWNFVEAFIDGEIPRDVFLRMISFNHPTHQIVFCTEEALKTLEFKGSESL